MFFSITYIHGPQPAQSQSSSFSINIIGISSTIISLKNLINSNRYVFFSPYITWNKSKWMSFQTDLVSSIQSFP